MVIFKICLCSIVYFVAVTRVGSFDTQPLLTLIIDGEPARQREFPSTVSIEQKFYQQHYCGGSIINKNHVVSAAHCIVRLNSPCDYSTIDPLTIQVVAGDTSIQKYGASLFRRVRYPTKIYPHPDYTPRKVMNDIAVIRVVPNFIENQHIKAIQIISITPPPKVRCLIAGWGYTRSLTRRLRANNLAKAEVEIKSNSICNSSQSYDGILPKNTICAGFIGDADYDAVGLKDACQGDSGGPLICQNQLCGIVSFGIGCGQARFPGIYTDVSKYRNWVYLVANNHANVINLKTKWLILYLVFVMHSGSLNYELGSTVRNNK